MRLAEYDIKYIHILGKGNISALGLSSRRNNKEVGLAEGGKALGQVVAFEAEEGVMTYMKEWLEDEWYSEITYYKPFGDLEAFCDKDGLPLTTHGRRLVCLKARSYQLIEVTRDGTQVTEPEGSALKLPNSLLYVE